MNRNALRIAIPLSTLAGAGLFVAPWIFWYLPNYNQCQQSTNELCEESIAVVYLLFVLPALSVVGFLVFRGIYWIVLVRVRRRGQP